MPWRMKLQRENLVSFSLLLPCVRSVLLLGGGLVEVPFHPRAVAGYRFTIFSSSF